ncbi:histidine kinase/DNA gyrase B/HSP90-like ATPase [Microbacterium sp. BK668]|nr:histidine kinase/DNA gyrase B/HSP90-like ATPase [Microbacterium sp. BK668]
MAGRQAAASAASRVFAVLLAAVVVVGAVVALLLVFEAQRAVRAEAERVTKALAETIAATDSVGAALPEDGASARLQPYAERLMSETGVDFITIMTPDGIRVTHRDPAEIGRHYLGTIPASPETLTEEFSGTLGPSVRTIAPVEVGGRVVGWASVGVTVQSLSSAFFPRLPFAIVIALAVVAAGFLGALAAGRITKRVTGDLPAGSVRDAVSSYESVRTLGEALRAQTHEHGNRMHTAVALLELGRTEEAIEILTETSRQSQTLVDQVTARRDGDPTVGALLLGKASQARERGVDWIVDIDPAAPRSTLAPVDAVSVVGNLLDNALDAAASGDEPRWVRVELAPADGGLRISVADSGRGIPADLADRIWRHGFSTKPAGADGRGVGLALVKSIVEGAGGSIEVEASPTVFRVVLPARRP